MSGKGQTRGGAQVSEPTIHKDQASVNHRIPSMGQSVSSPLPAQSPTESSQPSTVSDDSPIVSSHSQIVLSVSNLAVSFRTARGLLRAVRGVSFALKRGKTLAIVGESGSGKSATARTIMGLGGRQQQIDSGHIYFQDIHNGGSQPIDLLTLSKKQLISNICGQKIAMIFQDPMSTLNPTMSIGRQIMEAIRKHQRLSRKESRERGIQLLEEVGIRQAAHTYRQYPHQLSGGMRQRVVIAIALACNPQILICDEPTTALDVTIQARILELIARIQQEKNLSVIYITHDFGVVARVADEVAVMYAGQLVEKGTADDIFYDPVHPYTRALLSCVPDAGMESQRLYSIPGIPPDLVHPIVGDAFAPRNEYALNIDFEQEPPEYRINDTHTVRSWLLHEEAPELDVNPILTQRLRQMQTRADDTPTQGQV
ncbi:ABC transporter ATP-binding protein [Paenibacillus kandeliae]|uniref:ABC transporter ATP-binding protein n=1 Tax=Paenibacillus kandeliae TaxID=3231269 RepID=UPI00345A4D3C